MDATEWKTGDLIGRNHRAAKTFECSVKVVCYAEMRILVGKKIYDLENSGKDLLKDVLGMLTLQQPVFTGHSVLVLMVNTILAEVR